ncbi:MAG: hypothetical protein AAGF19_06805 [Pseudomonadota bacterium]
MTTPQTILAVEALLALPLLVLGVSHIVQKEMWVGFFSRLAAQGRDGVIVRTFLFELWPASLIVVLHQDWSWPGVLITVYGHLLMVKVVLSLIIPSLGERSLEQAERRGDWAFLPAGLVLIGLGALCAARAGPAVFGIGV